MTFLISAPLINANEDTAVLVEWFRKKDDYVKRGEILCLFETSKSTFELQVEQPGYFVPLVDAGETVTVGTTIAALKENRDDEIVITKDNAQKTETDVVSRKWTKKAEILAQQHGLDLNVLSNEKFQNRTISEEDILSLSLISSPNSQRKQKSHRPAHYTERVLIMGGGNSAALVMDILGRVPHQRAVGILDDNPKLAGTSVQGCPIVGKFDEVHRLWDENAFDVLILALGAMPLRAELYEKYTQAGIPFGNIIDPSALILSDVTMGTGNSIMGLCRIGPEASIGNNNFLSAYNNLEHHNRLGDHCTFGPAVFTSGGVVIGSRVRFGTGIFIEPRLTIGDDVTIASGVTLTTNVPSGTLVKNKANFSMTQK